MEAMAWGPEVLPGEDELEINRLRAQQKWCMMRKRLKCQHNRDLFDMCVDRRAYCRRWRRLGASGLETEERDAMHLEALKQEQKEESALLRKAILKWSRQRHRSGDADRGDGRGNASSSSSMRPV